MNSSDFLNAVNRKPAVLTADEVRFCLEGAGAFWIYKGEPSKSRPHACLTSGKHSNGFVNVGAMLKEYAGVRWAIACTIIAALADVWQDKFTCVVGADTSSTDLAGDIADITSAKHIRMQKHEDGEGKKQIWCPDNEPLADGDIIFHIEELITTSLSAMQVREGIRRRNPDSTIRFVPFLLTVVDRSDPESPVDIVEESKVSSLLRLHIRNFDPDNCPYCAAGSDAIKPKDGNNWSRLTGQ